MLKRSNSTSYNRSNIILRLTEFSKIYSSLLRNYEGVANFAASDKAEFMRLKNGREAAEKEA